MKQYFLLYFFFISCILNLHAQETTSSLTQDLGYSILFLRISDQIIPDIEIMMDSEKVPLMLDTGASNVQLMLRTEVIMKHNVQMTNETGEFKDIVNKTTTFQVFKIPEIRIGNYLIKKIRGKTFDKLWGGSDEGFLVTPGANNGILGLEILKKFKKVLIDYKGRNIVFSLGGQLPAEYNITSWTKFPFKIDGGILTQAQIDKHTVNLIWDTGSNFSVIKPSTIGGFDKLAKKKIRNHETSITPSVLANGQEFGPIIWESLPENSPLPQQGIIGGTFFTENIVCFDFEHMEVRVKRNSNFNNFSLE